MMRLTEDWRPMTDICWSNAFSSAVSRSIRAARTPCRLLAVVPGLSTERGTEIRDPACLSNRSMLQMLEEGVYSVDGTPTDCVNLGIQWLMRDDPPDLVVSGINFASRCTSPIKRHPLKARCDIRR